MNQKQTQQKTEKKKSKRLLLIVLPILLLVLIAGACFIVFRITNGGEQGIEKCLSDFETCYNNSDMEGLLECFNEDTQDKVSAAVGLGTKIFGIDTSRILSVLLGFGTEISGHKNLDINIESIKIENNKSAEADTTFDFGNKQYDLSLTFTKEHGNWRISEIDFD